MLAFTFKGNQVKNFLEIFSSERIGAESCNKVQNIPSFPATSKQFKLFLPQIFWLFSNPPPHRVFLFFFGRVSFNTVHLGNKE